jgi:tetratricopeptide (TPR) repeat protein
MTDVAGAGLTADRPFPGLRPFDFPDHDFFFGRDHEVYSLYRLVDRSRFIAVVGSSGSGKSSLVRAGLLPLLKEENESPGGRRWIWKELRPGNAPIARLAGALASLSHDDDPLISAARQERIAFELRQSSSGIAKTLAQVKAPGDGSLVLVVDQFEELFRYSAREPSRIGDLREAARYQDDADQFVQLLLEASRISANNVHVLLTMRSDFIGECARFHGLPEAVSASQFLVPSLTREQLEEVIRTPIERASATIEGALVQRLLNDSGSDLDQLPVLQHCLSRLWEQAGKDIAGQDATASVTMTDDPVPKTRRLTEQHYADIGRMSEALSRHADEILQQAGPEHVVEKVFRSLSEVDKQRRAIRRAISFSRLWEETGEPEPAVRDVVDRFRADDCSFLGPSKSSEPELKSDTQIDVGHEALLRRWKRVSGDPGAVHREDSGSSIQQWVKDIAARMLRFLLRKPNRVGDETRIAQPSTRSVGWLQLEEKDGETYRSLLSWANNEKGALPFKIAKSRQRWWTSRHPTSAWAERNGGGFDRVERLINVSAIHHRRIFAGGALAAVIGAALIGYLAYAEYSIGQRRVAMEQQEHAMTQQEAAIRHREEAVFQRAVISAQELLDQVGTSLNHGDITVRGAQDMLNVATGIVEQVKNVETPQTIELVAKLARTASDIHATLGNLEQAYESAKSSKDLLEPLHLAAPNDPKFLSLLYHSFWRMGDAIADRDTRRSTQEHALKVFLEAEQLARQMAAMTPEDGDRKGHIVFVLQKIGDVRQSLNDWPTAIAVYSDALNISQDVADRAPGNRDARRQLANSLSRLGQALTGKGELETALERHRAAFKIRTDLWAADRNDDVIQSNLAGSHRDIARTHTQRGDLQGALAEYQSAIAIQEDLQAKDPTNATWQGTLAPLYAGAGDVLRRKGDLATALEHYRKAYTVRRVLALRDPSNPGRQEAFAGAGMAVADLLVVSKGDIEEAVKLYRGAIESVDDLRPRYDRTVFLGYIKIGDILKSQNDPDGAFKEYNVASSIARESATRDAASTTWQRNLEISYAKIGDLLAAQGRAREMFDHYREALDFVVKLAAQHPENSRWAALAQSLKTQTDKEER